MRMEHTIELTGLRFYAYHGVEPQERVVGGWYSVSVKMVADLTPSLCSDSIEDTLNYGAVADIIKREMTIPSNLIEHVAGRILKVLNQSFPQLRRLTVRVDKHNPPIDAECDMASVTLEVVN